MIKLDSATFDDAVAGSRPTLVEFWADWCPPCRMIEPVLAEIAARESARLTVAKVNGDENPGLVSRFGVLGYPTLLLLRDGEVLHRSTGARPKRRLMADIAPHLDPVPS